jgi:hypothetical protein
MTDENDLAAWAQGGEPGFPVTPDPAPVQTPTRRTYAVTLSLTLDCDEDVVTRTQQDGWREQMYDVDEHGAVGMLAVALQHRYLSNVDGWADMRDDQADVGSAESISVERIA